MGGLLSKLIKAGFTKKKAMEFLNKIQEGPKRFIKHRARKKALKDLSGEKAFNRYRNNILEDLDLELEKLQEQWDTVGQFGPNEVKVYLKNKIMQLKKQRRKLFSKDAYHDYQSMVNTQVKETPINFGYSDDMGHYIPQKGSRINKDLKGVGHNKPKDFEMVQPTDMLLARAKKLGRHRPNSKSEKLPVNLRKGVHGTINLNPYAHAKRNSLIGGDGLVSTGVHELKHAVQSALPGYRAAAHRAVKKGYDYDASDYAEYIARPEEVSARLSQYRILPRWKRYLLDTMPDSRLKNNAPSWYRDLRSVIGDGDKIKEQADKVWAAAPLTGMLGALSGDE